MPKHAFLVLLAALLIGCSAERRDVVRYFEAMQPYFTQLNEYQAKVKQVSALPYPDRAQAYRRLAREAEEVSQKVAAVKPPQPAAEFHQQYVSLWKDFLAFVNSLADLVDTSLPEPERAEADKRMQELQAAWPGKAQAVQSVQTALGKKYGIDFQ